MKQKRIAFLILAAMLLCGCQQSPDSSSLAETEQSKQDSAASQSSAADPQQPQPAEGLVSVDALSPSLGDAIPSNLDCSECVVRIPESVEALYQLEWITPVYHAYAQNQRLPEPDFSTFYQNFQEQIAFYFPEETFDESIVHVSSYDDERDEFHRLEFACEPITASNSVKYFQETYEFSFGETITSEEMLAFGDFTGVSNNAKEDIFHTYVYGTDDDPYYSYDLYLDAVPEGQYPHVEYFRAINDRYYMDMNRAYLFELYNREFVNQLVGDTSQYEFSWRPSFDGIYVGAVDVDEDCTYSLYGKDISLQKAFAFAEDYFSNHDLGKMNSSLFTYRKEEAEVYRYGEENYGYYMWLKPCYDGITVGAYDAFAIEP